MSNIEKYPKCNMRTSLGNCDPIGGFCTSVNTAICEALHKVAEPRTGEWKEEYAGNGWNDFWDYTCSECGRKFHRFYKSNFCPNCGADMGGKKSDDRERESVNAVQH